MRHIENENEEECETNQQCVRMKELFRRHAAIDWEGANLNAIKYKTLNKIITRKYAEICMKY